jgi:hypothetical protein
MKKWIRSYDWWAISGCALTYVGVVSLAVALFSFSNTTLVLVLLLVSFVSAMVILVYRKKLAYGAWAGYLVFLLFIGNVLASLYYITTCRKTERLISRII